MSQFQKHLDEETILVALIKQGRLSHLPEQAPDHHIETGLAHVFFYGDTVYKQYKIVGDETHFIKGVLAPSEKRHEFIERDFTLNQHFSGGVYKALYGHELEDESITLSPYERKTPHVWYEMERLDFSQNFHEQLLTQSVTPEQLYALGYFTAEAVAKSSVESPSDVSWYDLAKARLGFLEQFIAWLPEHHQKRLKDSECMETLQKHLEEHKSLYETITGADLSVSLDNHDENIFFKDGAPIFIDVVPPMSSWWYGVPVLNLANIAVNVGALLGEEAVGELERGFCEFHGIDSLPEPEYSFTKALALVISATHFGSLPDKEEVAERYVEACCHIKEWL